MEVVERVFEEVCGDVGVVECVWDKYFVVVLVDVMMVVFGGVFVVEKEVDIDWWVGWFFVGGF